MLYVKNSNAFIAGQVSGQSLIDVLIAMAVGTIVSLGIGTIITFGAEQFNSLREQNLAEESLIHAAYTLRLQLSNAVKTYCCANIATCSNGAAPAGSNGISLGYGPALPVAADFAPSPVDFAPLGIPVGVVDCRSVDLTTSNSWGSAMKPLAIFVRENGDGNPPTTSYLATGIFFQKPTAPVAGVAGAPGVLYFADADGAGAIDANADKTFYDHFVNIGVEQNPAVGGGGGPATPLPQGSGASTAPAPPTGSGAITSIDFHLRVRYFKKVSDPAQVDYRPEAAMSVNTFRDVDMVVSIPFRNNIIGFLSNGAAGQTAERIHGGLYYFKFASPPFGFENL
jgi:hypothetical protein